MSRPVSRRLLTTIAGTCAALAVSLGAIGAAPAPAQAAARTGGNVVTPGDFTGYGFDQCLAPNQHAMNVWLNHSPFLAAGIYISGDSRACRNQPNLSAKWVRRQLAKGWRLLPITLGPQASCQPRFPRYGNDATIIPKAGSKKHYKWARRQGRAEAVKSVKAAQSLGIVEGSTLWYDLEGFDASNTRCRESALAFLSAWTWQLHALDYVSGVYSSAGSGIKVLDNARVNRPDAFNLPDQIWVARWDGVPNTSTSYIREDGWHPHSRIKQYQGGHDETWGRVRINIDRNYLDIGRGSWAPAETHCKKVPVSFTRYAALRPPTADRVSDPALVKAFQCLLREHDAYRGKLTGAYDPATQAAANAWQEAHGFPLKTAWSKRNWMTLLAAGATPALKTGSAGGDVRRLQRALIAAYPKLGLVEDGVFGSETTAALRFWQDRNGLEVSGVSGPKTWTALNAGTR